jgi:enamine deaminase RidA (YjgF/YER057c/UK114 family)
MSGSSVSSGAASAGFSDAIEVRGPQRTLYIAGQVASLDGDAPADIEAQCHSVWDKIERLLADAQMSLADVVKTTVFLTSAADVAAFRKVRGQRLGAAKPASTLVIVTALVRPELKVEVEAIASKAV